MNGTRTAPDRGVRPESERREPRGSTLLKIVALYELRRQWHSGSFWWSTGLTALLLCLSLVLPVLAMVGRVDTPSVGLVDGPYLARVLDGQAEVRSYPTAEAARRAVLAGEVEAALLPGGEVAVSRGLPPELTRLLQQARVTAGYATRLERLGVPAGEVTGMLDPGPLRVTTLEPDVAGLRQRVIVAGVGMIVLIILMMQFSTAVAQNVAEERSGRIVELLLPRVAPARLLTGKTLGVGAAALSQALMIVAAVLAVGAVTGAVGEPVQTLVTTLNLLLWFAPALVLFIAVAAVVGTLVSSPQEVGTALAPLTLFQMLCCAGPWLVISETHRALVTVMSLVPGVSWATMPVRMAYGDVPWWQAAAAYALMLLAAGVLLWLTGRTYARGVTGASRGR